MKRRIRTMEEVIKAGSLLTVPEAAQALGVTEMTVRTWAKKGELPSVRLAWLRFDPLEVKALIDCSRRAG